MPPTWETRPLHTIVVELLEKKKGTSTDLELYKSLEDTYADISFRNLNKALMKLEIDGLVHLSNLTKNERRVELVKKAKV